MGRIKDPSLARQGGLSYEWARSHMALLDGIIRKRSASLPLEGLTLGFSIQLTKETAVLLIGAKKLGACVVASSGNPLTTQDDIAAFLESRGITVYGWSGQTQREFEWCVRQVMRHKPDIVIDDGAHLCLLAHSTGSAGSNIIGSTEETATGIRRTSALASSAGLLFPVIAVNNTATKYLFDNLHGTGQSGIEGFMRAARVLFAGKKTVIAGYGWVGRGVARRCRGMGARVIVTEADPIRALEAVLDGYDVMPMNDAARTGDIFMTCTGMTQVIDSGHIMSMKSGAILGNLGHFDVEIDVKFLKNTSKSVTNVRPGLDEYILPGNHRIFLVSCGRVANLAATSGNPPEVMAQSFSNQLLSILYIRYNHQKLPKKIIPVPRYIDALVASGALESAGIRIDHM